MLRGRQLGGRTYFCAFYEGRRFPAAATIEEWTVPSMLMRQGIFLRILVACRWRREQIF